MSINLATNVKPELWSAVSSNYESGHYKDAILDAMRYLSDMLRAKTGLDSDGIELAGAALGGNAPLLRINKLQTETEKNIQKGVHHLVMGMYGAIRNPRSHEQMQDTKNNADAIIYFVDYILQVLDASEEPFTIDGFLERLLDPYFVDSPEYAELLVNEIPRNKRLDTLIEVFRQMSEIDDRKLELIDGEIIKTLSEVQLDQFLSVVSDELRITSDYNVIRKVLRQLRPELWPRISQVSRLRIENMLIKAIDKGEVNNAGNCTTLDAITATWSQDYLEYFSTKDKVASILTRKFASENTPERRYATKFFLRVLGVVIRSRYEIIECVDAIVASIEAGDEFLKENVRNASFPNLLKDRLTAKLGEGFWPSGVDDIPF